MELFQFFLLELDSGVVGGCRRVLDEFIEPRRGFLELLSADQFQDPVISSSGLGDRGHIQGGEALDLHVHLPGCVRESGEIGFWGGGLDLPGERSGVFSKADRCQSDAGRVGDRQFAGGLETAELGQRLRMFSGGGQFFHLPQTPQRVDVVLTRLDFPAAEPVPIDLALTEAGFGHLLLEGLLDRFDVGLVLARRMGGEKPPGTLSDQLSIRARQQKIIAGQQLPDRLGLNVLLRPHRHEGWVCCWSRQKRQHHRHHSHWGRPSPETDAAWIKPAPPLAGNGFGHAGRQASVARRSNLASEG